nr:MAG TPA: hypothetical protein [Caudoviricetes sp.]
MLYHFTGCRVGRGTPARGSQPRHSNSAAGRRST